LPNSTPKIQSPSQAGRILRALGRSLACGLCLLALLAPSAFADGDPASDVLAEQVAFVPWDAGASEGQQATLTALLKRARSEGHPLRVALVASASDLGSVTALWRMPQSYAEYLGDELSLVYKGPLLVVMPNGFGLHGFGSSTGAVESALSRVDRPAPGAGLGGVALLGVRDAAAATGSPLPADITAPGASATSSAGSRGIGVWVAFAVGAVLIALAWAASLRAKPLRPRRSSGGG